MEKNIYGLSEGVFKACEFLGLKFPAALDGEHVPSDYFGDDLDLDFEKLRTAVIWDSDKFKKIYGLFIQKFATQQPLRQCKTDLNIFFCDFLLFVDGKNGALYNDYFDLEFYKKSFATRAEFRTQNDRNKTRILCNSPTDYELLNNEQ